MALMRHAAAHCPCEFSLLELILTTLRSFAPVVASPRGPTMMASTCFCWQWVIQLIVLQRLEGSIQHRVVDDIETQYCDKKPSSDLPGNGPERSNEKEFVSNADGSVLIDHNGVSMSPRVNSLSLETRHSRAFSLHEAAAIRGVFAEGAWRNKVVLYGWWYDYQNAEWSVWLWWVVLGGEELNTRGSDKGRKMTLPHCIHGNSLDHNPQTSSFAPDECCTLLSNNTLPYYHIIEEYCQIVQIWHLSFTQTLLQIYKSN